jgi:hypothetical protein
MKSLQKTFQTNADKMGTHQFTLIKRTSTVAMYRRDWLDGKLHSYEVFKVKTVKAGAPLPGGSFVQEDYESYPGKGGFGRYGYSCKTLERANHWFEHLSHLNDNSNTSDNGEPLDDSNSIKSERSSEIGQCLEGFRVKFDVIEHLAAHKKNCGYEYTIYHKKPKARSWSRWQRRSPAQQFFQRISGKLNPRSVLLH